MDWIDSNDIEMDYNYDPEYDDDEDFYYYDDYDNTNGGSKND